MSAAAMLHASSVSLKASAAEGMLHCNVRFLSPDVVACCVAVGNQHPSRQRWALVAFNKMRYLQSTTPLDTVITIIILRHAEAFLCWSRLLYMS